MATSSGHVIVCGLSALGVRVAEQLVASGVAVVVVDDASTPGARRRLERRGARIVREPPHSVDALREADIDTALAVAACHDVDLDNLQTAIAAAEVAPTTRLVVAIGNAQLGDQVAAAIPDAQVINPAARVGPSFVEACLRSDVVHAFTMRVGPDAHGDDARSEVFAVVDAVVDEAEAFRARYGDLTPIALRRAGEREPVFCPPRDIPLAPGDHLTVLGRLAEFDAREMAVAGLRDARTFAALAAHATDNGRASRRGRECGDDGPRENVGRRQGEGFAEQARALGRTVRDEFDQPFRWALAAMLTIVIVSTVLLTFTYEHHNPSAPKSFGVLDALYLTVETMTTVGYGDFNFGLADHWLQAFGIVLMLVGALSVAVIYAFITNVIISRRLERALGRGRAGAVRGHVVLCGLGKVGTATMEGLLHAGRRVVVIERNENNRYLSVARERGVPVVIGDATVRATLLQAGIGHAIAIAALTSDGVANLETVLSARDAYDEVCRTRRSREAARAAAAHAGGRSYHRRARQRGHAERSAGNGDDTRLRVVLRTAETTMTEEVERRFDIHTVRSAAALASPYVVGAALGYDVISTFYVQRSPFLVARMVVRDGAALAGPTLEELASGARILAVTSLPARTGSELAPVGDRAGTPAHDHGDPPDARAVEAGPPQPDFRPGRNTRLRAGDELLVVGPVTEVVAMIRRNRPARGEWPAGAGAATEPGPLDD